MEDNKDNVSYGEIYYLNYYGINIFLGVTNTLYDIACVYELAKKKFRYNGNIVEVINGRKPSKKPLLVIQNNCERKSRYWVHTGIENDKKVLYIKINYGDPLHKAAEEYTFFPSPGLYKAIFLEKETQEGFLNFYWDLEQKKYENKKEDFIC